MSEQITVLGISFNSDEERREYFREELRKQLPEQDTVKPHYRILYRDGHRRYQNRVKEGVHLLTRGMEHGSIH